MPIEENRALVNLDLYDDQIKQLAKKIDDVKCNKLSNKDLEKAESLTKQLKEQQEKLNRFRHSYDVKKIETDRLNGEQRNSYGQFNSLQIENFFQHMQAFEGGFKEVRMDVMEFISAFQ